VRKVGTSCCQPLVQLLCMVRGYGLSCDEYQGYTKIVLERDPIAGIEWYVTVELLLHPVPFDCLCAFFLLFLFLFGPVCWGMGC